jgi:replicative DNA helicase
MTDHNSPPSNIEAEEAILGSILLDPCAMNTVADILTADAFYILGHQQIYSNRSID